MGSRTLTLLTSVGSLRQARRIARALIGQRLTACVHIAPIESVYRWQGRVHEEREFQLSIHTTAARAEVLQSTLRALHPYELPALTVVAPARVDASYARWVAQNCAPPRVSPARRARAKGGTAGRP